jgi:superfamily I DNA and/or RNA helicase
LQLAQVSQGSHPVGTDLSILEHLLGEHETVPPNAGVFLDISYRMHPAICTFISDTVYEARLHSAPSTVANRVDAPTLPANGLCFIPVEHVGNTRASVEEAQRIVACVQSLLGSPVSVGNRAPRAMTPEDILVVSPYNAQRTLLRQTLTEAGLEAVRVGTVDKFQGQEAPVVLYSMATSSGDDLPRDMEFLFERNRFNVALSRAQVLSVLVCSPRLLDVRCSTPEQMRLVNLLCAFAEKASVQAELAGRS